MNYYTIPIPFSCTTIQHICTNSQHAVLDVLEYNTDINRRVLCTGVQ